MDPLTPLEQEALETLLLVRDYATTPMGLISYREMMGDVMKAIKHLENKQFGCPTGFHTTYCTCVGQTQGIVIRRPKRSAPHEKP